MECQLCLWKVEQLLKNPSKFRPAQDSLEQTCLYWLQARGEPPLACFRIRSQFLQQDPSASGVAGVLSGLKDISTVTDCFCRPVGLTPLKRVKPNTISCQCCAGSLEEQLWVWDAGQLPGTAD